MGRARVNSSLLASVVWHRTAPQNRPCACLKHLASEGLKATKRRYKGGAVVSNAAPYSAITRLALPSDAGSHVSLAKRTCEKPVNEAHFSNKLGSTYPEGNSLLPVPPNWAPHLLDGGGQAVQRLQQLSCEPGAQLLRPHLQSAAAGCQAHQHGLQRLLARRRKPPIAPVRRTGLAARLRAALHESTTLFILLITLLHGCQVH